MTNKTITTPTSALAKLFYDQCVGQYSGHMSAIPNNPLFSSIFYAAGLTGTGDKKKFAEILRAFAEDLDNEGF